MKPDSKLKALIKKAVEKQMVPADHCDFHITPQGAVPFSRRKFTLIYSAESANMNGHNMARLDDGSEVPYTNMTDESEHGPWQNNYLWEDAKVVGYVDGYDAITEVAGVRQARWKNVPRPKSNVQTDNEDQVWPKKKFDLRINEKINKLLNELESESL